jgi:hypothetical protein
MGGTPKIVIPDGPSTFDHLRTVNTGQFFYQGSAQLTSGSAYNIFANINFGSRTFGGGNSRAVFNDSNFAGTVNLGSLAFGSGPQTATFAYSNLTGLTGSGCSSGCRVDMNVTPQNQAGVVGATAQHNATVNALINFGAGTVPVAIATGSGTAGRNAGLAP